MFVESDRPPFGCFRHGAASQLGALPVPPEAIERAITEEGPAAATNLEAFAWGRWLVHDASAVEEALRGRTGTTRAQAALWEPSRRASRAAEGLLRGRPVPEALHPLLTRRAAQLVDYQDAARARRWLELVEAAAAADSEDRGWALTEAVAAGFHKLLTYKDEYEVARLHLRLDLDAAAEEVGAGGRYEVRYHLHPPFLRRLGRTEKLLIGGRSGRTAFRGLAAAKRLRGTRADVFGYARHRREERQLIEEYESVVRAALGGSYDGAVAVAASAGSIKGYDEIKSRAIAAWRAEHLGAAVPAPAARR